MSELKLLYSIREALGFNQYFPLSHLDDRAKQMHTALLACAPLAHAAISEEKKNEIGNSDLDDEQPVALTIRTTLGAVRECRRALMVAGVHARIGHTELAPSEIPSSRKSPKSSDEPS